MRPSLWRTALVLPREQRHPSAQQAFQNPWLEPRRLLPPVPPRAVRQARPNIRRLATPERQHARCRCPPRSPRRFSALSFDAPLRHANFGSRLQCHLRKVRPEPTKFPAPTPSISVRLKTSFDTRTHVRRLCFRVTSPRSRLASASGFSGGRVTPGHLHRTATVRERTFLPAPPTERTAMLLRRL